MMEKTSDVRSAMRSLIDDSRGKKISSQNATTERTPVGNVDPNKSIEISNALNILKTPKPRSQQQLSNIVDLSSGTKALVLKTQEDRKSTKLLSARVTEACHKFLEKFESIHANAINRSKPGLGSTIQNLIEDYAYYRNEEVEHCRELSDYVRQTVNAEKEFSKHYSQNSQEELEAKEKFHTAIKTLRLVINIKRLTDPRLVQLVQAEILNKNVYSEIHYYLNFQIYEKWEERGL